MISFDAAFEELPLVAILRGLTPDTAAAVGDILVEAGFRIIEVPLNSPDPFASIEKLAKRHGDRVLIGAGTVLDAHAVRSTLDAGGRLVVAPNFDARVGAAALAAGAEWCPGVMTPTEAFAALESGATALKIFPAELVPPAGVAAMRAVLPKSSKLIMVGGVTPDAMAPYRRAGADGFGLGSALFKTERALDDLASRAAAFATGARALP